MTAVAMSAEPVASRARAPRVAALDALRGLTVVGMIVANSTAYLHAEGGYPAYPALLHSAWAGFSLADSVFPSFIVLVGASLAFGLAGARNGGGAARDAAVRAVLWRALRLVVAGFLISNLFWLQSPDGYQARLFGVLQRIGLVYGACALLYLYASPRMRLVIAAGLLAAYWPLTLAPFPDGVSRLDTAGLNYVSWLERNLLGAHTYVTGPRGFDPEGLLSTLPAIAQGLIGVAAGEWLRHRAGRGDAARDLALAGLACLAVGLAWAAVFPPVKALWTSSFVLISSGPPLILLAGLWWWLDVQRRRLPLLPVLMAFGANAILAYVIHEVGSVVLEWSGLHVIYDGAARLLQPEAAALVPVALFVTLVWLPIGWLYRERRFVRI